MPTDGSVSVTKVQAVVYDRSLSCLPPRARPVGRRHLGAALEEDGTGETSRAELCGLQRGCTALTPRGHVSTRGWRGARGGQWVSMRAKAATIKMQMTFKDQFTPSSLSSLQSGPLVCADKLLARPRIYFRYFSFTSCTQWHAEKMKPVVSWVGGGGFGGWRVAGGRASRTHLLTPGSCRWEGERAGFYPRHGCGVRWRVISLGCMLTEQKNILPAGDRHLARLPPSWPNPVTPWRSWHLWLSTRVALHTHTSAHAHTHAPAHAHTHVNKTVFTLLSSHSKFVNYL